MKQNISWKMRMEQELERRNQAIPGMPLVEILGRNRVLIEHHGGVVRYGKEQICVRVSYGQIRVEGCGLELAKMTKGQLIICGKIQSVHLLGEV